MRATELKSLNATQLGDLERSLELDLLRGVQVGVDVKSTGPRRKVLRRGLARVKTLLRMAASASKESV